MKAFSLMAASALLCLGCSKSPEITKKVTVQELGPEEAKQALIQSFQEKPDWLAEIRDAKVSKLEDPGEYGIGRWQLNLKDRNFFGTFRFRDGGLYQYKGIFFRDEEGNWKAKITEEIHAKGADFPPE